MTVSDSGNMAPFSLGEADQCFRRANCLALMTEVVRTSETSIYL
jgi:hypothetical protein